ncbi:MAG TPA: aldo/keto reductase [bacterium]|jgi:aryl-alcohol dehydrogenase-like predicted oxidoreductase|nr:aldo/keto reductase [bacterium]
MEKRKLGRQGLEVPCLGLGCMGMSFAYGKADRSESLRTLDRSLELGIHFWDTAESYGPHLNEELLAEALKGRREKVILATKFGWKNGIVSPANLDGSGDNVRLAVEGSLKRLGTDYIDLLYLHRLDPKTPIEETVGAMSELVRQGKVKYLGLSEVGPQTLRRAHRVHPLTALQSEYSLWETRVEETILPTLRELGIGFVPFSPVGRGFLTGEIKQFTDLAENDNRRNIPRFQGENFDKNLKLVEEIKKLGAAKNATASQIALAWLLSRGKDIVPIPGTTKVKHLEENAQAAGITLDHGDLSKISRILSEIKVSGERYGEMMQKMVSLD